MFDALLLLHLAVYFTTLPFLFFPPLLRCSLRCFLFSCLFCSNVFFYFSFFFSFLLFFALRFAIFAFLVYSAPTYFFSILFSFILVSFFITLPLEILFICSIFHDFIIVYFSCSSC